jgi:hypothetical protein
VQLKRKKSNNFDRFLVKEGKKDYYTDMKKIFEVDGGIKMKKEWMNPEVETLDVKDTAFGPYQPDAPDSEKTQITKPDGTKGWEQLFGDPKASN